MLLFSTSHTRRGVSSGITPSCTSTKYNIPSSFDKYSPSGPDAGRSNFSTTTREEYGSYLSTASTKTPNPTAYSVEKTEGQFGAPPKREKDPHLEEETYKVSSKARLSSLGKARRFPEPKMYKDKMGPGLYEPERANKETRGSVLAYSFEKSGRSAISKAKMKIPGTGTYTPQIDSRGGKDLGDASKFGLERILNGTRGFKPRGFSVVPRFEDKPNLGTRIAVSDKYVPGGEGAGARANASAGGGQEARR
jgi:hypothetical protein